MNPEVHVTGFVDESCVGVGIGIVEEVLTRCLRSAQGAVESAHAIDPMAASMVESMVLP